MIQTLICEIKKEEVGNALPHEHILCDLRPCLDMNANTPHFHEPLTLENRYVVYTDPYLIADNAVYDDEDVAVKELLLFKESGGKTIFDCTTFTPDYEKLIRISERTGVQIVMGCGHYVDGFLTEWNRAASKEQIAERMIKELTVGFDGTTAKAGFIGEIGTGADITPYEWKNVLAAGIASKETNSAIHFHTALWERHGLTIAKTLIKNGVAPEKICIDHIDVCIRQDYLEELLKLGVYVEYDNFGKEFFLPTRETGVLRGRFAYDLERCQSIKRLIDKGYTNKILITNDICLKSMLCSYGGNGFGHINNNIKIMLKDVGVTENQIEQLLVDNVADFFDR